MKNIVLIFLIIFFSKILHSKNLFETEEYELDFNSENIIITKEEKIDEIKIKSFLSVINKILTKKNYINIEKEINVIFVNNFILNMTINQEKIVNNNYFALIKINFNKDLIINYFIKNKINFIEHFPKKFLILIFEENNLESNLLTKKNSYYKYLLNSEINLFSNIFLIPNLDFNDRYIFNKENFENNRIYQINKLNSKYKTDYQVLVHSIKKNDIYYIRIFLIHKNNEYLIDEKKIKKLNIKNFYLNIYSSVLDKWKELNQIDTNFTNTLDCKININNIHELKFVRNLLISNRIIKNLDLKSIMLNENIYNIVYFGNIDVFKKSLERVRLNLFIKNNKCNIQLI